MDRLISTATTPAVAPCGRSAAAPTLRPLLPLHRRALSLPRVSPPGLFHSIGFKSVAAPLFEKREGFRLFPVAASADNGCSDGCFGGVVGGESFDAAPLTGGRELDGLAVKKIIRSAVVVILSAIVLTVVQPVLAPPSYATVQSAANSGGKLFRTELLSSAWTGFFAGCLHTLSGPDHLAALAPLSIGRTRIESALVGALWGCGHDAGQMIFGLLFLILKDRLHIEIIRTWGTRVVGLTLLVIGAMGIKEASEVPTPCVALENGECVAEHVEAVPTGKKKVGFATFATGIVHGLQPDALMMVLPALALPSRLAGAAFLGMFLVGTVFAMGSYTVFIGSCTQALKERVPRITEKLTWAASLIAISMGLGIIVSQFFGFSLY